MARVMITLSRMLSSQPRRTRVARVARMIRNTLRMASRLRHGDLGNHIINIQF